MKKTLCLILALALLPLVSCNGTVGETDVFAFDRIARTMTPDTPPRQDVESPFQKTEDLLPAFSPEAPIFDSDRDTQTLSTRGLNDGAYTASEASFTLPEDARAMLLQCTWWRSGKTVYIGLLNTASGQVYTISFVGGSVAGSLALEGLPAGEYKVILYTNGNEAALAVLAYQLL